MKNNNKAYTIGGVVLIVAIVAGLLLGQSRKDRYLVPEPGAPATAYQRYISDKVNVLTASQEEMLCSYNAKWDSLYDVTVAFVSERSISGSLEDYAYDWGGRIGLDELDAVLLYVADEDSYWLAPGDNLGRYLNDRAVSQLSKPLNDTGISFGAATVEFYEVMDGVLADRLGSGGWTVERGESAVAFVVVMVLLLLVIFAVLCAVESSRFNAYRRQYYGVVNPPVVFHPIFFWHRPGSAWYRRNWRPAPPPPPRQPPRGPGPSSGGFGGSRRPPSGPSRPSGGFGGSRSSFGGSRPGSFGGSRGGSFGGSRGGFSGGSRGGGFGGRR